MTPKLAMNLQIKLFFRNDTYDGWMGVGNFISIQADQQVSNDGTVVRMIWDRTTKAQNTSITENQSEPRWTRSDRKLTSQVLAPLQHNSS